MAKRGRPKKVIANPIPPGKKLVNCLLLPEPLLIPDKPGRKIDIEKAVELRLKNLSYADIAKHFSCSPQAVHEAISPYIPNEIVNLDIFKAKRSDILAAKQFEVLQALDSGKLQNAGVKDLAIVFGTIYDKERLERGLSTQNSAVIMASAVIQAHGEADK